MVAVSLLLALTGVAAATPTWTARTGQSPADAAVTGSWINPDPQVTVSLKHVGTQYDFVVTSHTLWHGSLEGTTTFTTTGVYDTTTKISTGTVDETFTGSVPGGGKGTLHFAETFTLAADGSIDLHANIISGTGGLSTVTGQLHFVGHSNLDGTGTGTYDGALQLPSAPPTTSSPTTATTPTTSTTSTTSTTTGPAVTSAPPPVPAQPAFTG